MTNEDTTDFDEHFAKISSYIVDTLHGVPLEMTEDEIGRASCRERV